MTLWELLVPSGSLTPDSAESILLLGKSPVAPLDRELFLVNFKLLFSADSAVLSTSPVLHRKTFPVSVQL
jgi:hypothetical protein